MARHGVAETLTGAVVLLIAGGFLAYAVAHSGRTVGSGYPLRAEFDRIDGLATGADVKIGGVKVGTVTDERIDPASFKAIVSFTVQDNIKLPKDTAAVITSESLLGGKYISLAPGGDTTDLKPGQTINITQSSVSLEELLGKFIFSASQVSTKKEGEGGGSGSAPTTGGSTLQAPK
ncbi:MAG: outer membrane lipid asymmetry maintenance protein MlaD [Proteobacteria bacterium]|nr:outer membrane lipid asymmetry maintenance protein MlaD [Pseudomonadota bacterium]